MYININIKPTKVMLVMKKAKKNLWINFTGSLLFRSMVLSFVAVLHIDYMPTIEVFT
jgi:hypothetical protein